MKSGADASSGLLAELRGIVGPPHVLTGAGASRYAAGYRVGGGPVAAVVRPGSLVEQWRTLRACIAADYIVIPQAANTGLTGGSTPDGTYDRPVVVVSTLRIRGVHPILAGRQVVCLAGSTLYDLERTLAPLGREPHSVIGSSCIGASVVGGVCNSSGGALVARGPAYTEYALFAQVDCDGQVRLRNHLGIALDGDAEAVLCAVEAGRFGEADIAPECRAASAAAAYGDIVRAIDAPTPARFNADPARLFDASGSAGKVMVFAVRLDTFARAAASAVFYIGSNDPGEIETLRRRFLAESPVLPVSGEYIHREAFDLAARYGKDTVAAIRALRTDRLPTLFRLKDRIDRIGRVLGSAHVSDRLLQLASRLLPQHLPRRMRDFRDRYEHHLILKVADEGIGATQKLLDDLFPSEHGDAFPCTPHEAGQAMLHRFAVAGAAVRFRAVHSCSVEGLVALDVALRRDELDWFENLPTDMAEQIVTKLYYGHFFCHVLHQDYLLKKGVDPVEFERRLLALLDARGAEYPAEHNVGHHYRAKPALADHYRNLDPGNRMNPGIGATSRGRNWADP